MADANRDEAARCLEIARAALAADDFSKAARFAEKATRLFSSDQAKVLLREIERKKSSAGASQSSSGQPAGMSGAGLHSRAGASTRANGGASAAATPATGTLEQRKLVRTIIQTKDYYEMLSCTRGATDDDLKRGYKKLALKLHPDKNQAAGSVEAFKAVSRAYACLSDPDKRANYDRFGHEDPGQQLGRRAGPGGPNGMYADQFDPEDIFNAFFGGGFGGGFGGPGRRVYTNFGGPFGPRPRQQQPQQPQQPANPLHQLLQFVPVLLLILFTFLSQSSAPAASLERQRDYQDGFETQRYSVPFFVRSAAEFQREYPRGSSARNRLEQSIELEYKDRLEKACVREQVAKAQAGRWGNTKRAEKMKMPHCNEIFERFGHRIYDRFNAA